MAGFTSPRRVYFAFRDGALGYDCVACGARCCHGLGFSAVEAELSPLLEQHSGLALCCRAGARPGQSTVWNFSPDCFFLDGASRCVLHRDAGFAAKPFTCRWFPSNQFLMLEEILLVDLHPICPIGRRGSAGTVLEHGALSAGLRQQEEHVLGHATALPLALDLSPDRLVDHEEWCRDRLPACDGVLAAAAAMAAATERLGDPAVDLLALPLEPGPFGTLAAEQSAVARFLGVERCLMPRSVGLDEIGSLILALSPSLRLGLLAELPWLSYRRFDATYPRVMLVLELFLRVLASMSRAVTGETVRQVATRSGRLLWILAHLGRVPLLCGDLASETTVKVPRTMVAGLSRLLSFVHRENERRRLTLGEAVTELGFDSPRSRVELLASLPDEALSRLSFE